MLYHSYVLKDNMKVGLQMFYFFFESRKAKAGPGGPGCCSKLALFYENVQTIDSITVFTNGFCLTRVSNILFVGQPTRTGFSYSSSDQDTRHDETGVSNDLYNFLQAFYKAHPDYINNDFYITGESYIGHYIPCEEVSKELQRTEDNPIPSPSQEALIKVCRAL
ncbi:hypothetical protein L2E82_09197 [Cichorium intybus]|uniref:Uncharacterized protein n=1 Tax=Cichorium intybus TaxID=13427 RepID=A0ACB9G8S9_CICIN|nr:hypothetical protein L2E82_09197 [Cichorium intybus]